MGTYEVKKERAKYWISKGAQVSPTMHNFLIKDGVLEGRAKNVLSKKSPTTKRKEAKK
jgi:ribosomal protein S16